MLLSPLFLVCSVGSQQLSVVSLAVLVSFLRNYAEVLEGDAGDSEPDASLLGLLIPEGFGIEVSA